jgi:metallo-beta-lactamase class B
MRQRIRHGGDAYHEPLRRRFLAGCLCCVGAAVTSRVVLAGTALDHLGAMDRPPAPTLERIADGVYLHTSWAETADGLIPSNGLVVVGRNGTLMIDTAGTEADTALLIERIDQLSSGAPLLVYATHAHVDRLGGLGLINRRGERSMAHETTVAAAMSRGLAVPTESWIGEAMAFEIGDRQIELFHPGGAHTRDNTVVYLEDVDLLYGGCMVRPANASTLGHLADADLATWPTALSNLVSRFGHPAIVVPGHGPVGDGTLLTHSLALASTAAAG